MKEIIKKELFEAQAVLNAFVSDANNILNIEKAATLLADSFLQGNKALACGNGGSSCDAMHFCEELTGRFREDREPLPAIALNADSSFLTCVANDFGYKQVFYRHLKALGKKGDVLLAISTSGNSENILLAAQHAQQNGILVIGLTGKDGGKLAQYCDVELRVNHLGFSDRIQEIHIKIIHILVLLIEQKVFGK